MSRQLIVRIAAATRSTRAGVITKWPGSSISLELQTVRSLVFPPMRMTPRAPSARMRPSSDWLSGMK